MTRWAVCLAVLLGLIPSLAVDAHADGISVDAGVTPPEDRLIWRLQLRHLGKDADEWATDPDVAATVLATALLYGLRRDVTVGIKQGYVDRRIRMMGEEATDSGLTNLVVLGKYGITRTNTRDYTFALATTLQVAAPTGHEPFSSKEWGVTPGLFATLRSGPWSTDASVAYAWSDVTEAPGTADELALDWAASRQLPLTSDANVALAPVVELSYRRSVQDEGDAAALLFASPGLKFVWGSFITEALLQLPVWQTQAPIRTGVRGILGTRLLF
jgi:hypothetical protein